MQASCLLNISEMPVFFSPWYISAFVRRMMEHSAAELLVLLLRPYMNSEQSCRWDAQHDLHACKQRFGFNHVLPP